MNVEEVARSFRESVSKQVTIEPEGLDRFRVFTPFQFEDRDHLAIVLKRSDGSWVLSDEGHTFMHLTAAASFSFAFRIIGMGMRSTASSRRCCESPTSRICPGSGSARRSSRTSGRS